MGEECLKLVDHFQGSEGFEEFRKYIKFGNELCRNLSGILQERYELEVSYAKSLSKISAKLSKTATACIGTVSGAWITVAKCMDEEAELHKNFAISLQEDIYKPMTNLADSFHKARKPVESAVDKSVKVMQDKRDEESRAKKRAFSAAKDAEKSMEQLSDLKNTSSGSTSSAEKEEKKTEKKAKSQQELAQKAEKDYFDTCLKAEIARVDGECVIYKGIDQLQRLEVDRLKQLFEMLKKYQKQLSDIAPSMVIISQHLQDSLNSVRIAEDIRLVATQKGSPRGPSEQLLFDLYCEDLTIEMERNRREKCLKGYIVSLTNEIEKEQKGKEGLEKLLSVYQNRPQFADDSTQEELKHRLNTCLSTLNFLHACQFKLSRVLANLNCQTPPTHTFAAYMETGKDRFSLPQTILRVPVSPNSSMGCIGSRDSVPLPPQPGVLYLTDANADGFSSDDFDSDTEYDHIPAPTAHRQSYTAPRGAPPPTSGIKTSSIASRRVSTLSNGSKARAPRTPSMSSPPSTPQGSEASPGQQSIHCIGWCRAIYDFKARQPDELSLKQGEVVSIYSKQDSEWWHGSYNGKVGIFPVSYVEEF